MFGAPFEAIHVRQFKFSVLNGDLVRTMGRTGPLSGLANGSIRTSPIGLEFDSGDEISVEFTRRYDTPTETFDLFDGAEVHAGRYAWNTTELQVQSSSARNIGVDVTVARGGFSTSRSSELIASMRGRFAPRVNVRPEYNRTAASLPQDQQTLRCTAQTARLRLDLASSLRRSSTLSAQWDNESKLPRVTRSCDASSARRELVLPFHCPRYRNSR